MSFDEGNGNRDVHTNYAGSHSKSLESIFNGKADACAVSSQHYKSQEGDYISPTYTDMLQKYHVNDTSIRSIPAISENDNWRLKAGFCLMQDSTILQKLGIQGFGKVTDGDYDSIREVARSLHLPPY